MASRLLDMTDETNGSHETDASLVVRLSPSSQWSPASHEMHTRQHKVSTWRMTSVRRATTGGDRKENKRGVEKSTPRSECSDDPHRRGSILECGRSVVWTRRSSGERCFPRGGGSLDEFAQASCFFRPTSVRTRSASRAVSNGFRNVSLNGVRSKPLAVSSSLRSATNTASA